MFDFTPVIHKEKKLRELAKDLSKEDLRRYAQASVAHILDLIADCIDAEVVFEPTDPEAHDEWAATEEEVDQPWTLGHVIVHVTASAEEFSSPGCRIGPGRSQSWPLALRDSLGKDFYD